MNDVIELIKSNGSAVLQAPWAFATCVIVVGYITYLIVRAMKQQEIDDLTSRIGLRDDEVADYKRKLEGRTPDEAKAAIDELRHRLKSLEPLTLSSDEKLRLITAAAKHRGSIRVNQYIAATLLGQLHRDLIDAFVAAGWNVSQAQGMGNSRAPRAIMVRVADPDQLSPPQKAAIEGLAASGLQYELIAHQFNDPTGPVLDLEIVLCTV